VASNIVDDSVHSSIGRVLGGGLMKNVLADAMISFIKPTLVSELKTETEHFVSTGSFTDSPAVKTESDEESDIGSQGNSRWHSEEKTGPESSADNDLAEGVKDPAGLVRRKYSLRVLDSKLGFHNHAVKSVHIINRGQDEAVASVVLHNKQFDQDLSMTMSMSRKSGTWRIERIDDFPKFIGGLIELQSKAIQSGNK